MFTERAKKLTRGAMSVPRAQGLVSNHHPQSREPGFLGELITSRPRAGEPGITVVPEHEPVRGRGLGLVRRQGTTRRGAQCQSGDSWQQSK